MDKLVVLLELAIVIQLQEDLSIPEYPQMKPGLLVLIVLSELVARRVVDI